MIQYRSMTVSEALDEILDKVSQFQTASNLDTLTVWMFLNRARREVFARTLPFKDYAYVKRAAVSNGVALPADFTRPLRVILRDGGIGEYSAARKAVPKEWWSLTNTSRPNTINGATPKYPIYMIWGGGNFNDDDVHFYCAPSTEAGFIEYYSAYSDLPKDVNGQPTLSASLNVPYEFENLVIQSALLRCYARIAEKGKLAEAFKNVQEEYAKIQKNYAARQVTEAINLRGLMDPEPSKTPGMIPGGNS